MQITLNKWCSNPLSILSLQPDAENFYRVSEYNRLEACVLHICWISLCSTGRTLKHVYTDREVSHILCKGSVLWLMNKNTDISYSVYTVYIRTILLHMKLSPLHPWTLWRYLAFLQLSSSSQKLVRKTNHYQMLCLLFNFGYQNIWP